ncbi:MAG: hypothetical protein ACYC9K_05040 [Sulfuricaulis sp.]
MNKSTFILYALCVLMPSLAGAASANTPFDSHPEGNCPAAQPSYPADIAGSGDTLVRDRNTGNWVLTHNGVQSVYVPGTKFTPCIQAWFEAHDGGKVTYRYRLRNSKGSMQPIEDIRIMTADAVDKVTSPRGWQSSDIPDWQDTGWKGVSWSVISTDPGGIDPGKSLEGISFSANYLPGIAMAEFQYTPNQVFYLNGGDENMELEDYQTPAFDQLVDLMSNNYISRNVAAPAIAIPNPFDPAVLLTAIQSHIDKDLVRMNLIDPLLVTSLDQVLQTAIHDLPAGNMSVVRRDIEKARHLIEAARGGMDKDDEDDGNHDKDKPHLIDKLAARVLDFDLRYVERHIKDKDD